MPSRKSIRIEIQSRWLGIFLGALLIVAIADSTWAGDWRNHQGSMGGKQSKMKGLEGEIEELIHHKKGTEDPEEINAITTAMAEKHAELEKIAKQYREESLHIRFKHPEKGDETERKYPRYQVKTLHEMESAYGLDAKLDRVKAKMHATFGTKKPASAEENSKTHIGDAYSRAPAQSSTPAAADERIRLRK